MAHLGMFFFGSPGRWFQWCFCRELWKEDGLVDLVVESNNSEGAFPRKKKKKNNLATLKWWKYPAKNNAAPETKTWDGKTWICLSFGGVMVSFSWHHVTLYTGCLPEEFFYMVQICVWVICVCFFLKGRFVLKKEHLQHLLDFWRPKNYWGTWS